MSADLPSPLPGYRIAVAGDVAIDWLEYSTEPSGPPASGTMEARNWQRMAGTRMVTRPGGALMLAQFIKCATGARVLSQELSGLEAIPPDEIVHSMATLARYRRMPRSGEKDLVYRVDRFKGFAGPTQGKPRALQIVDDDPDADLVVLDDAGSEFRGDRAQWPRALEEGKAPLIVLKMNSPLAHGQLWDWLVQVPPQRLIVVVAADDLRLEDVNLSRRLSWERTAKDCVWQMSANPKLAPLAKPGHLVVRFGLEGAMLFSRLASGLEARLFFDPKLAEDGFIDLNPGQMPGYAAAFVAALASKVAAGGPEAVGEGVRHGLLAARRLHVRGFGPTMDGRDNDCGPLFEADPSVDGHIADVVVPHRHETALSETADPDYWCILEEVTGPRLETVAFNTVVFGTDAAMEDVPMGQFRHLTTLDRSEIESFRSIRNLIREYLESPKNTRPLSIAVFGAPGSGKSFGVREVAQSVAPDRLKELELNVGRGLPGRRYGPPDRPGHLRLRRRDQHDAGRVLRRGLTTIDRPRGDSRSEATVQERQGPRLRQSVAGLRQHPWPQPDRDRR
ncbi:MAG: hypothetical protein HY814_03865 [Candidatus Riflebacteria bacterium]|nr:hypothetical protein [Candidatus Riflebacteria bacterium]